MTKVLDVRWFSGRTTIGIVRVETEHDGIEYRISTVSGYNEDLDKEDIKEWGSRFPNDAGDALFGIVK